MRGRRRDYLLSAFAPSSITERTSASAAPTESSPPYRQKNRGSRKASLDGDDVGMVEFVTLRTEEE